MTTKHNTTPITLEYRDDRWWIAKTAGPLPASPWEVLLWQQVQALERTVAEQRAVIQQLTKAKDKVKS